MCRPAQPGIGPADAGSANALPRRHPSVPDAPSAHAALRYHPTTDQEVGGSSPSGRTTIPQVVTAIFRRYPFVAGALVVPILPESTPSCLVALDLASDRLVHSMMWTDRKGRTPHRAWLPASHRRVDIPHRTVQDLADRGWLERRRTDEKPAGEAWAISADGMEVVAAMARKRWWRHGTSRCFTGRHCTALLA